MLKPCFFFLMNQLAQSYPISISPFISKLPSPSSHSWTRTLGLAAVMTRSTPGQQTRNSKDVIWNTSARLSKNGTVPSLGCALWMGEHREAKRKYAKSHFGSTEYCKIKTNQHRSIDIIFFCRLPGLKLRSVDLSQLNVTICEMLIKFVPSKEKLLQ